MASRVSSQKQRLKNWKGNRMKQVTLFTSFKLIFGSALFGINPHYYAVNLVEMGDTGQDSLLQYQAFARNTNMMPDDILAPLNLGQSQKHSMLFSMLLHGPYSLHFVLMYCPSHKP